MWDTLSPVWQVWQTTDGGNYPAGRPLPDPAVVAADLKAVAGVISKTTAFTSRPPQARLEWVMERRHNFISAIPVFAAALIHLSVTSSESEIAAAVSELLSEPEDRPAFGWLPFIRDCLWPREFITLPEPPVADRRWPAHLLAHLADEQRVTRLLLPNVLYLKTDDPNLFPHGPPLRTEYTQAVEPALETSAHDALGAFARELDALVAMDYAVEGIAFQVDARALERDVREQWRKAGRLRPPQAPPVPDEPSTVGTPAEARNAYRALQRWAESCSRRYDQRAAAEADVADQPGPDSNPAPDEPFVPNPLQKAILAALKGKGQRQTALVANLSTDPRRLHGRGPKGSPKETWKGGIQELIRLGKVSHHKRIGYYRPDDPPDDLRTGIGPHGPLK